MTVQAIECCIGYVWSGFVAGEATRVRSFQKLPPCLTEPGPGSSKMDPHLAKDEATSDGGGTSGTMYLRSGEKILSNCRERSNNNM